MDITNLLRDNFPDAHLVGGCLRDVLMGHTPDDIDIAAAPEKIKEKTSLLAKKLGGTAFPLDEENLVYRITVPSKNLQIDISAVIGKDIGEDLTRRDFTINSMAYPLSAPGLSVSCDDDALRIKGLRAEHLLDPFNGEKDIGKGVVRSVSAKAFDEDPLRLLRAFRFGAELDFSISQQTLKQITERRSLIAKPAGERIREELLKMLSASDSRKWLALMEKSGILYALFPELEKQKSCAEVYYGKGGVFKHTLQTVDRMEFLLTHLQTAYPQYYQDLKCWEKYPGLFKFAALLHDIAKPATARKIDGRLRFFLHEEKGSAMAEEAMQKLRFSRNETRLVSAMIREHLRPGNLASNTVITDRAVYRFFRDLGESAIPLLLLCWADHSSYISVSSLTKNIENSWLPPAPIKQGKMPPDGLKKTLRHLQVINLMFRLFFKQTAKIIPQKLLSGNDVMKTLKVQPGPEIGRLLEEVRLAQVEGKVSNREEAIAFLKTLKRP